MLSQLEKELSNLSLIHIDIKYINSLRARVQKLQSNSSLKFNSSCAQCTQNKQKVASDLVAAEKELAAAESAETSARAKNEITQNLIADLNNKIQSCRKITSDNMRARDLISEENKLQLEIEIATQKLSTLRAHIISYNLHKNNLEKLHILQEKLVFARSVLAAKQKIAAAATYKQYLLCQRRDILTAEIADLRSKITSLGAELQISENNVRSVLDYNFLCENKAQLRIHISKIDTTIGNFSAQLAVLVQEITILEAYSRQFPILDQQLQKYKLYADTLDSPALRAGLIKKNITKIIEIANDNLGAVSDFTILPEITDKSLDFYIIEAGSQIPAEASGFQKFIVSISLRLALTKAAPASSNFIIIDEGFGCMDAENIRKLSDLFAIITNEFQFTFIISHIDELQNIIENPLYIHSKNDTALAAHCSYITNTVDTANPLTALAEITEVQLLQKIDKINHAQPPQVQGAMNNDAAAATTGSIDSFTCECGKIIKLKSRAAHMKSVAHARQMQKIINN